MIRGPRCMTRMCRMSWHLGDENAISLVFCTLQAINFFHLNFHRVLEFEKFSPTKKTKAKKTR